MSSSGNGSAFDRLSRPGSGRISTDQPWDRSARPGSGRSDRNSTSPGASLSSASTPSISPTSPMGPEGRLGTGFVPDHHRIKPPSGLNLPSPGGGWFPMSAGGASAVTSPVSSQGPKRNNLKISFSQPNFQSKKLDKLANLPFFEHSKSFDKEKFLIYKSTHSAGKLKFNNEEHDFKAEDLDDKGEIGRGAFGTVNRMVFRKTGKVMAVKRIRSTVDEKEQKELLMDLDVVMKSNDCPYIVLFFGAIFKEGDCWICMELMDTSTDKFYKFIYDDLNESIPETVLGKMTVATLQALNYLKEKLKIIHRDVKPSNILLDKHGNIKLCDFGISGQLVDSIAKTRDAGCRPYMAPERIDPQRAKGYDVRSDVWSLGITLIELSTGCFPYPKWNSVFEQLQQVVHGDPPKLELRENGRCFTPDFVNFVNTCLIKDETQRPKYVTLLKHPFIKKAEQDFVDVSAYVTNILERWDASGLRNSDGTICEPMSVT